MAQVSELVPFIQKWEGGFSDHPLDKGGPTMKGITLGTFQWYRKSLGMPNPSVDDLKKISMEEWTAILKTLYWDAWQADKISSQAIASILVDWAWGSGTITSIKAFQNLTPALTTDGIVGDKTLGYINNATAESEVNLFNRIWDARKAFLDNIVKKNPSQQVFYKGWMNRLNDIRKSFPV